MRIRQNRVIIDTNLWISYLISKDYFWIDKLIQNKDIWLVFSRDLMDEFLTVVQRPKLSRYFSNNDLEHLVNIIDQYAVYCKAETIVDVCRDPKDNFLLSLAKDGQADYLLTGDLDLLDLKQFGKTKRITIKQFKDKITRL